MHARAEGALAALQERMSVALLAGAGAAQSMPEDCFAGAHPGATGLTVHRNTVLGALAHALRSSHAAVERLVGESFFDRMAVDFARAAPPRAPQLDEYGAGFAAWIAGFPGSESLPYLSELARFEWALSELGRRCVADDGPLLVLDNGARLQFAAPLRTFASSFPVDELRTAILTDDADGVAALELAPRLRHYAAWRVTEGVRVRALSAPSARFLDAVLAGADGERALAAAASGSDDAVPLAEILAREILPAGFVRVSA
jgi:hypothetical protein